MLIFKDETQGYFAKVADFGFSTRFRKESDVILIPRSRPWDAPEYHSRGFLSQAAQKMDVYRFGLLCLWLLFGSSGQTPLAPWMAQENGHFINLLEDLKSDENALLKWATWLVEELEGIENDMKDNSNQFFDFTLDCKPENRKLYLGDFLNLLDTARYGSEHLIIQSFLIVLTGRYKNQLKRWLSSQSKKRNAFRYTICFWIYESNLTF